MSSKSANQRLHSVRLDRAVAPAKEDADMRTYLLPWVVGGLMLCSPASGKADPIPYNFTQIPLALGGVGCSGMARDTSVNAGGTVAFRANLVLGGQGIFTGDGQALATIHTTVNSPLGFTRFGRIPSINAGGTVAFQATFGPAG